MDKRWDALASILVNYSIGVKPGERLLITMMEVETEPLARACYREAVKAGGYPFIEYQSAYLEKDLMLNGSMEQVEWVNEMCLNGTIYREPCCRHISAHWAGYRLKETIPGGFLQGCPMRHLHSSLICH